MSKNTFMAEYRWRPGEGSKDWGRFTLLFGVLVLMIPFSICTFSRIFPSAMTLMTHSQLSDGRTTEAIIVDITSIFDGNDNMSTYRFTYTFEALLPDETRERITGTQQITYRNPPSNVPQVGETVMVVYDPGNPTVSLFESTYANPSGAWSWVYIGMCFGGVMLLLLITALISMHYNLKRLLSDFMRDPEGMQRSLHRRP